MFHVTADSNIFISAFNFGGNPERLIDMARRGQIELAVSGPIMNEIARILAEKFHWFPEDVVDACQRISGFTRVVSPTETLDVVKADPTDNRMLECALAAGSDVVVTGDRHLLTLGSFRGIDVITVSEFLQRVEGRAAGQ